MSNVTRNIKNSVYNTADVIVYPVFFFATIPFFMNHLGEEVFGLWMLMNSLIIAFQIFNFGLAPAIIKYTAYYRAKKDADALNKTIHNGLGISFLLLFLSICSGAVLAYLISKKQLFALPASITGLGVKAMLLTSVIIGLKFSEQVLLHVFKGMERFDLYFFINNTIRFLTLGINMVQIYFFTSLTAMLAVSIIVTLLMIGVQMLLLKKTAKWFTAGIALNKENASELLSFGFFTWIQSLIVIVTFQIDRYIVVSKYGTAVLGYYALVATIFVNIHTCITAAANWLIPKIVNQSSAELYKNLRAFVTLLGFFALIVFCMLYKPVFKLWVGDEKLEQMTSYIQLFTAFEFFYFLMIAPPLFLNYSGNIKQGTKAIYIVSLLNMTGLITGFLVTGTISGMLWGLLISTIAGMLIVYEIINQLVLKRAFLFDALFFLISAGCASLAIFYPVIIVQVFVLILVTGGCLLYFVKFEKNNIRLLFH